MRELERVRFSWYPGPHGQGDAAHARVPARDRRRRRSGRRADPAQRTQRLARRAGREAAARDRAYARRPSRSGTTKRWLAYFAQSGVGASPSIRARRAAWRGSPQRSRCPPKGAKLGTARAMIVGVPNSGKSYHHQRALAPGRGQDGRPRRRDAPPQWFRLQRERRTHGYAGSASAEDLEHRKRNGNSRSAAPLPRDLYDPQEVAGAFSPLADRASPHVPAFPDLETFARRRGFRAPRRTRWTTTTPPTRTSARSTTARSGEFRSRRPMTPKQRKAKNAYERERRRLHRLHHFEYAARAQASI